MLSGRISTLKDDSGAVSINHNFGYKTYRFTHMINLKEFLIFNFYLQIFIDRDPVLFIKILSYMRTKDIDLK